MSHSIDKIGSSGRSQVGILEERAFLSRFEEAKKLAQTLDEKLVHLWKQREKPEGKTSFKMKAKTKLVQTKDKAKTGIEIDKLRKELKAKLHDVEIAERELHPDTTEKMGALESLIDQTYRNAKTDFKKGTPLDKPPPLPLEAALEKWALEHALAQCRIDDFAMKLYESAKKLFPEGHLKLMQEWKDKPQSKLSPIESKARERILEDVGEHLRGLATLSSMGKEEVSKARLYLVGTEEIQEMKTISELCQTLESKSSHYLLSDAMRQTLRGIGSQSAELRSKLEKSEFQEDEIEQLQQIGKIAFKLFRELDSQLRDVQDVKDRESLLEIATHAKQIHEKVEKFILSDTDRIILSGSFSRGPLSKLAIQKEFRLALTLALDLLGLPPSYENYERSVFPKNVNNADQVMRALRSGLDLPTKDQINSLTMYYKVMKARIAETRKLLGMKGHEISISPTMQKILSVVASSVKGGLLQLILADMEAVEGDLIKIRECLIEWKKGVDSRYLMVESDKKEVMDAQKRLEEAGIPKEREDFLKITNTFRENVAKIVLEYEQKAKLPPARLKALQEYANTLPSKAKNPIREAEAYILPKVKLTLWERIFKLIFPKGINFPLFGKNKSEPKKINPIENLVKQAEDLYTDWYEARIADQTFVKGINLPSTKVGPMTMTDPEVIKAFESSDSGSTFEIMNMIHTLDSCVPR